MKTKTRPTPRGSRARRTRTHRQPAPATIAAAASRPEPLASPRPVVARLLDADGRVLATYTDTPQREQDRRFALARWDAERDLVAGEWQDAVAGSVRQQDAEALLANIDAVRDALAVGPVPAARLSTLERRLAEFQRASLIPLARRGQKHTGRGYDDITKVVNAFLRERPGASMPEIRTHLRVLAQQGHEIVRAVGVGTLPAVGRLDEYPKLPRLAVGWRDVDSSACHTLRDEQLVRTVKRERARLRRPSH